MQALRILSLLAALGCFEVVAQNATLSIDAVSTQVSDFLQLLQNGSVTVETGDVAQRSLPSGCSLACGFLGFVAPSKVACPGSPVFTAEQLGYWSQQQASISSTCRFSPTSALDVSLAVLTFQVTQCQFAVKSGGHAAFAGASNIDEGVTIDLINLNQITVSADKKQTSVGPGNRWKDVYNYLEPKGLAVIGGRVSDIGTGLILGGGISFFSARYGWACDNVNNYEVVFADGTVRDVSYATYPDLYFALRGGGNNFGIVTRFDLVTFPQGAMWAGSETFIYSNATAAALNLAFQNLNINTPSDPYAQVILAYAYYQPYDLFVIASDLQYGKPVANPPILSNFTAVPGAIASTLRITNLTGLVSEFAASNPDGFRQTYWALMVKNSASLMADITNIFMEEVAAIKTVAGVVPSCVYQPISTAMTSKFSKNGGNPLGITVGDGPLNLINIVISWSNSTDDAIVMQAARNIVNRARTLAVSRGLGHPYLYQNYAALEQPVFASYGAANLAKLKAASRKYDPLGVWQKLQPGYFKTGQ